MARRSTRAEGAWGLRFPTVRHAAHVLVDAPEWHSVDLDLHCNVASLDGMSSEWDSQGMRVVSPAGGYIEIEWPLSVTLSLPDQPLPEFVIQPHLNTAAASIAMRRGWQAFHAGAFELDGGAWGILGAKQSGKSSTLALAFRRGSMIVTDDLLVVGDGVAMAGPRCIDLRIEPAQVLDMGIDLGRVGFRERWRVYVDPCPPCLPIAGFIVPSWGEDRVQLVPPVSRLPMLIANSSMQGLTMNDPDQYLRLASRPMLSWSRPRSWSTARESFDRLIEVLSQGWSVEGLRP
jgi:hypothetical protein